MLVSLALLFFSCQQSPDSSSYEGAFAGQSIERYEEYADDIEDAESPTQERKLIRTAELRFMVDDLMRSSRNIESATIQNAGFISSVNQTNSSYTVNNTIVVRVPIDSLDKFLNEIASEAIYTDYKRVNSRDVTEEYIDISSRLETKREVRDRYIAILRSNAETVEDILEVEEKIGRIQEEIEAIEGRLKYLNDQTELSTVTVTIYQKVAYVQQPDRNEKPFGAKLKEGLRDGLDLLSFLVVGLVTIWPLVVLIGLFMVGWRWRRRRNSNDD